MKIPERTYGNWYFNKKYPIPAIINQIYAELKILPNRKNIYLEFLKKLKSRHNLVVNILEIGSGCFPIFCKIY